MDAMNDDNSSASGDAQLQSRRRHLSGAAVSPDHREAKRQRCHDGDVVETTAINVANHGKTVTISAQPQPAGVPPATINGKAPRMPATVTPEPDAASSHGPNEPVVPSIQRLHFPSSATTTNSSNDGSTQGGRPPPPCIACDVDKPSHHAGDQSVAHSAKKPRTPTIFLPRSTTTSRTHPLILRLFLLVACGCVAVAAFWIPTHARTARVFEHIIPPRHILSSESKSSSSSNNNDNSHGLSDVTLRQFLTDPEGFHLAMAPSFFGFYGYFGMLAAWDEGLTRNDNSNHTTLFLETNQIRSVAGASAGAMAAVLLAMDIPPRSAADFCTTVTLPAFADPPGVGAAFRGDKFERIMLDFMKQQKPHHSLLLEDSKIPVAVTGFDLQTMTTLVMQRGSAARAARASATFPLLFQPVHWWDTKQDRDSSSSITSSNRNRDYVLIDGGVQDSHGLQGLAGVDLTRSSTQTTSTNTTNQKRVVNVVVGSFGTFSGVPPGPSDMPPGLDASQVLSISIQNLPGCGPWAMKNGPRARDAAYKAMMASFDLPLYRGKDVGHYELHIDASSFAPP